MSIINVEDVIHNDEVTFIEFLNIYIHSNKDVEYRFVKVNVFFIKLKLLNGDKTNNKVFLKIHKELNTFKQFDYVRFQMLHFVDLIRPKKINNNTLTVNITNTYKDCYIETNKALDLFNDLVISILNDQSVDIIEYSKKIYDHKMNISNNVTNLLKHNNILTLDYSLYVTNFIYENTFKSEIDAVYNINLYDYLEEMNERYSNYLIISYCLKTNTVKLINST